MAKVSQSTVLVPMGKFNLLDDCWKYYTAERKQRFPECVKDNFLTQLVNQPTRGAALPGLLFVNTEGLMGDMKVPWKATLKKGDQGSLDILEERNREGAGSSHLYGLNDKPSGKNTSLDKKVAFTGTPEKKEYVSPFEKGAGNSGSV